MLRPSDKFGISVALEGRWAIVGAQDDAFGLDPTGAAYLFRRAITGTWQEVAKLFSGVEDDAFGLSVALSGATAVVGAWGDDGEAFNAGAAHVYRRNAGGVGRWGRVARLAASDAASGDSFGFSVAIEGGRIVIGAPLGDTSDSNTGAVYVFESTDPLRRHWLQVAKLSPREAERGALFGRAVAVSRHTILVSAPWTDAPHFQTGAAHVFEKDARSGWREVARLTTSDASAADFLGGSVALWDGVAVVGANGVDDGGSFSGAAYVFERCPSTRAPPTSCLREYLCAAWRAISSKAPSPWTSSWARAVP